MSRFFGDKRIRYRGSSGEIRILLSHVRERGYSLYRLGQELGYHPRSAMEPARGASVHCGACGCACAPDA
jgi:hypothetical protein